jgi:hypothetical protein
MDGQANIGTDYITELTVAFSNFSDSPNSQSVYTSEFKCCRFTAIHTRHLNASDLQDIEIVNVKSDDKYSKH